MLIPTNVQRSAEIIAIVRRMDRHNGIITETNIRQGDYWDAPTQLVMKYLHHDREFVYEVNDRVMPLVFDDYGRILREHYDAIMDELRKESHEEIVPIVLDAVLDDSEEEFDAADGLDDDF